MLMYTPVHCAFSPISALSGIHQKLFQQPASFIISACPTLLLVANFCAPKTAKHKRVLPDIKSANSDVK
ncbi:MAG: hypothetical protein P8045_14330, partial [Candidatus Thiodiazotropha sp.]